MVASAPLTAEGIKSKPKWPLPTITPQHQNTNDIHAHQSQHHPSTAAFPTASPQHPPRAAIAKQTRRGRSPTAGTPNKRKKKKQATHNNKRVELETPVGPIRATFKSKREKLQFIEALAENKTEEDMTEAQSKYQQKTVNVSLMSPSGVALKHPAAPMLKIFDVTGCPIETNYTWTIKDVKEAVERGSHPSAQTPEAAAACRNQAFKKVEEGSIH